ncbi:MAG: hypothetical protein WCI03_01270 [bacterium]
MPILAQIIEKRHGFGVRRLDAAIHRRGLTRRTGGLSSQALKKRRQAAALQIGVAKLSQKWTEILNLDAFALG